jgi:hypothetical protein
MKYFIRQSQTSRATPRYLVLKYLTYYRLVSVCVCVCVCVGVCVCVCVRDARLAVATADSAVKPRIGRVT